VWDALRATLGTDVRSFDVTRQAGATDLKVTVVFPSEAVLGADLRLTDYSAVVTDASGRSIVTSVERVGIGVVSEFVPLEAGLVGPYTVTVTGDRAVSDPDTLDSDSLLNDTVTVQVVQLRRR